VGRQGHTPDFIVCHTTGGSFTSAINTIMNSANQVSYHYVVARDGAVTQLVRLIDTAWHAGTTNNGGNADNRHSTIATVRDRQVNANLYTVGIGFADMANGNASPQQVDTAVALISHIRDEVRRIYDFEIPMTRTNIIGHNETTPRTRAFCPGVNFPFNEIIRRISEQHAARPAIPPTPSAIAAGDVVRLTDSATYYDGRTIPAWVRNENWIVSAIWGDRAVIDKSQSGAHAIKSPVNVRHLTVVGSDAISTQVPEPATTHRPLDDIAHEVIRGNWGNGTERRQQLTAAGYDAAAVQRRVNEMLRA